MSNQKIQGVIDGLLDLEDSLSEWELSFVESVAEQYKEKGTLTQKQISKLNEIYDKKNQ